MKRLINYYVVVVLLGSLLGISLVYAFSLTQRNLIKPPESQNQIYVDQARSIQNVLMGSLVFRKYIKNEANRNEAVRQRITNYLHEIRKSEGLGTLGILRLEGDSLIVQMASGDYSNIDNNLATASEALKYKEVMFDPGSGMFFYPFLTGNGQTESFILAFRPRPSQSSEKATNNFLWVFLYATVGFLLLSVALLMVLHRLRYRRLFVVEAVVIFFLGFAIAWFVKLASESSAAKEREAMFLSFINGKYHSMRTAFTELHSDITLINKYFESSEEVTTDEFRTFCNALFEGNEMHKAFLVINKENTLEGAGTPKYSLAMCARRNPDTSQSDLNLDRHPEILSLLENSSSTGLVYCSLTTHQSNYSGDGNSLVVVQPLRKTAQSRENSSSSFIVAFIDIQELLNDKMNDGNPMNKILPLGLAVRDEHSHNSFIWLASFPPEHNNLHLPHNNHKHMQDFSLSTIKPLLFAGRVFYMTTHDSQAFDAIAPYRKGSLLFMITSLGTLLLALVVYNIRSGWFGLENAVHKRTLQLQSRVKELEIILDLSHQLTVTGSMSDALAWLCRRYNQDYQQSSDSVLIIKYKDLPICEECNLSVVGMQSIVHCGILDDNSVIGTIELYGRADIVPLGEYAKEQEPFVRQLQFVINSWIAFKKALQQLTEAEERFSKLVESSFDGIFMLENERFLWVNQAFADMVEYTREELTSPDFNISSLYTPKSREISEKRREMRKRGDNPPPRFDFQQLSKTGKVIEVEISLVSVIYNEQRLIFGIVRDVTEQRMIEKVLRDSEERLQQQNEELQLMNEELSSSNSHMRELNLALSEAHKRSEAGDKIKTAFLNNISHEVRTPLNGICGASEILSNPDLDLDEKKEMIEILNASTSRLLRTITQYMDISLLESGHMPVILSDISYDDLMKPILDEFDIQCKRKGLTFTVSKNFENQTLNTDRSLFEKVVSHLLENAVKFTQQGGVAVNSELREESIIIEIKDTGQGMDHLFHDKIFDLFVQEDFSNKRKFDGSGLGLPIVRRIVSLLGGTISFESQKGVGSTFRVALPVKEVEKIVKKGLESADQHDTHPNVLIAEDEDSNFLVLKLLMERKLKAQIYRATNGEQAVEQVRLKKDLNLVLMDIKMPVMDGYEATKLIKSLRPDIPVIAITAYGLSGDEQRAYEAGCDDYIAKPVQAGIMFQKINKLTGF